MGFPKARNTYTVFQQDYGDRAIKTKTHRTNLSINRRNIFISRAIRSRKIVHHIRPLRHHNHQPILPSASSHFKTSSTATEQHPVAQITGQPAKAPSASAAEKAQTILRRQKRNASVWSRGTVIIFSPCQSTTHRLHQSIQM